MLANTKERSLLIFSAYKIFEESYHSSHLVVLAGLSAHVDFRSHSINSLIIKYGASRQDCTNLFISHFSLDEKFLQEGDFVAVSMVQVKACFDKSVVDPAEDFVISEPDKVESWEHLVLVLIIQREAQLQDPLEEADGSVFKGEKCCLVKQVLLLGVPHDGNRVN